MATHEFEFAGQHPDEEVDFVFRQHPVVMRRTLIYFSVALLIGTLPLNFWPLETWPWWFLAAGLGVGLLLFFYRFIGWYYSVYVITSERLIQIKQKGFFDRRVTDISHNRILSVNYEIRGLQATMFHFGTLIIQTYVGELVLKYIHHPEEVQQHLNKIIRGVVPVGPANVQEETDEGAIQEA